MSKRNKKINNICLMCIIMVIIIASGYLLNKTGKTIINRISGKQNYTTSDYVGTDEWYKDYTYELDETEETITLTRYNGEATEVVIPGTAVINEVTYHTKLSSDENSSPQGIFQNNHRITSIVFQEGVTCGISLQSLFQNCSNLETIDFSDLNTSNVKNMSSMFAACTSLTNIKVSNFNTSSVENMSQMFSDCESLEELDLTNWNIDNVASMEGMFVLCENLEKIYSNSNWNTENITDARGMFLNCFKLEGAISYDVDKTGIEYANPDTGYYTRRQVTSILSINPNGGTWLESTHPLIIYHETFTKEQKIGSTIDLGENILPPIGPVYEVFFETNGGSAVERMTKSAALDKWTLNEGAKGSLEGNVYTFGESNDTVTANYISDHKVILPSTTREGYIFKGWYLDSNLTNKAGDANDEYIASGTITLYAKWEEINTSILTINPNGGRWLETSNPPVFYQETVTKEQERGTTIDLGEAIPPTGPVYEVFFETNGGSAVERMTKSTTFDKWTLNEGAQGSLEGNVYTFGESNDTVTANYISDHKVILPSTTREGYIFKGWYLDSNLINKAGDANEEYTANGTITLYAKWEEINTSILTINPNGGRWLETSNPPAFHQETVTKEQNEGTTIDLGEAIPPTGPVYEVFFETNGGSAVERMTKSAMFDKWTLNEGAQGSLDGNVYTFGESDDTVTANYKEDKQITLPNTTKEGYTFEGWYLDSKLTNKAGNANDEYIASGTITLYAKWIQIRYTITYNLDGGNIEGNLTTYTIETEEISLINPTKEGYMFIGWTGSNGEVPQTEVKISKGSTGEKEFTAHWERIQEQQGQEEYIINEEKQTISNISIKTTVKELKENLTGISNYEIKDKDKNDLTENSYIGTGCTIIAGDKEYTVIVEGDLNGTGEVELNDLAQALRVYVELIKNDELKKSATDLNGNGNVDLNDLAKLQKMFLEE